MIVKRVSSISCNPLDHGILPYMKRKKVIAGQHFNDAKHNIGQLTVHITTQATVIVQPIVFVRVGDVLSREAQTRNPLRGLNFTHKKRVVVQSAVHARQFLKN